jgi:hypothetical protein
MPLCLFIAIGVSAQSTKEEKKKAKYESLKALVDSRQYTFTAQSATPMSGRTRNLTSIYTLKINQDSLDADLPYFGRAYSATPGDTDGGIRFRSTSFGYDAQNAKNDGWVILVTPKNEDKADKMQLNITASGYSTLQVTSRNRQMISFYGQISANKKRR